MAQLAFQKTTVHSDSHGTSDDCEGGDNTTPPDRQTPLNRFHVVEPSDHRDPGSEASGPVASRTRLRRKTTPNGEIGLKNGGDLVEDVDREGSADATDVVATGRTELL